MSDQDTRLRKSIDKFRANCKSAATRWNNLMKHTSQSLFPAVPADALWEVAQIAKTIVGEPGHNIITEGEFDDSGESIMIIESGVVTIEKLVEQNGHTGGVAIGRLRPGGIIGDLRFLGCTMPRPGTVRAKTRMEACILPAKEILHVMSRFPGMLEACESQLLSTSEFMQHSLPSRQETLASLKLFANCHMKFLGQVGVS